MRIAIALLVVSLAACSSSNGGDTNNLGGDDLGGDSPGDSNPGGDPTGGDDNGGDPLGGDSAPTAWNTAVELEGEVNLSHRSSPDSVHVVMDPAGNAMAVWEQQLYDSGSGNYLRSVHASHYTPAGGWSAVTRLDNVTGTAGTSPLEPWVALDANGNGMAVWVSATLLVLSSATYTAGSGWGADAPLDGLDVMGGDTHFAMTPDGHAFFVYRAGYSPQTMSVRHFIPGTGWEDPVILKDLDFSGASTPNNIIPQGSGIPRVAAGANGDAVVTWRDPDGYAYAARYASGAWNAAEQLGHTYDFSKGPLPSYDYSPCSPAVDPDGNMTVVYQFDDGFGVSKIMSVEHGTTGTWSTAVALDPTSTNGYTPRVGLDGSGNAIAVWLRIPLHGEVWSSTRPSGGDWQTSAFVGSCFETSDVSLAVSANGSATVSHAGQDMVLQTQRFTPGSGWSDAASIDAPTGRSADQTDQNNPILSTVGLAMDPNGNAAAVWTHEDPIANPYFSPNTVWANTTPQ